MFVVFLRDLPIWGYSDGQFIGVDILLAFVGWLFLSLVAVSTVCVLAKCGSCWIPDREQFCRTARNHKDMEVG